MYIGVKDLISEFVQPFDRVGKATKKARKIISDRGEKITKETLEHERDLLLAIWDAKRERGEKVHKKICEKESKLPNTIVDERYVLGGESNEPGVLIPINISFLKNNTTYLEKLLCSNKYMIVGYADKVDVKNNTIHITDNKVVDNIYRTSSFTSDNGFKMKAVKMMEPLSHLDDCNYNEMVLQLSLYMYLAWENNKHLKIGNLFIRHIKMNDNDKVVKDELIKVPYMRDEVKSILKYRKLNYED